MMLKAVVAAILLTGLSAAPSLARDMHLVADEYIKSDAKVTDRDLALAILYYAAGLPDKGGKAAPDDIEAVGKIQLLASKIIGNGAPLAVTSPRPKLASAATIIILPRPKPSPFRSVEGASSIACEADKLMQRMQPGRASVTKPGECPNAFGSRDAVILLASKIIGNG
ncbi:hypothetical protein K32_22640 [Kaistia sp. 32K]|uniref:hypothetical protein n=1 Tax=Kaistia sp. 32K TaxID=2795690 RepID=UPI0019164584|nr:hypothetical protein [Kaistia sp. 32K]BCP53647.1 hypothetical protein K32_22640 [Kaistia sp. 32K]